MVRARIDDGRLTYDPPANVWGGQGTGALCEVCGKPIGPDEIEYEVQLVAYRPLICRLHFRCHAAWRAECDRRNSDRANSSG
jgi:hypothetical protein